MSTIKNTIAELAIAEWKAFGSHNYEEHDLEGKQLENKDGYYQIVGKYWKEGLGINLDGRNTDQAWSAAFVSYIMRKAGLGNRFLYSEAHRDFINKSIQNKLANDTARSWWGYRLNEVKPEVGDLICYGRLEKGPNVSYDYRPDGYPAHSDIVVRVEGNKAFVIGGNVSHSVTQKTLHLNANGYLDDTQKPWFVILKNRIEDAPAVEPAAAIAVTAVPTVKTNTSYSEQWLRRALEITGDFETSGDPFGGVTGDFDGMGVSCGVLQWNIGSDSLQPLIRKAGVQTVYKYMPNYGKDFWIACNSPKAEGLTIVRHWHQNGKLNKLAKAELSKLMASPELVSIQMDAAREDGNKAYELANTWAKEMRSATTASLQEFCWFFDLVVLNGGIKGVTSQQVKAFCDAKSDSQLRAEISNWIKTYPAHVTEAGKHIETFQMKDAQSNASLWAAGVPNGDLSLFALSYLRAQKSRPQFQLVTMNRKGTLALCKGTVNGELDEFSF